MEIWSSGAMLWAWVRGGTWRCLPQELRSSGGALQACCLFDSRDLELGRHAVGLATWTYVKVFASRAPELWRGAAGM